MKPKVSMGIPKVAWSKNCQISQKTVIEISLQLLQEIPLTP